MTRSRARRIFLAATVVVGSTAAIATAARAERTVAQLPPEIEAAIAARYPGATVTEREEGRRKFEAELTTADGRRIEVAYGRDGAFLGEEVEDEDDRDEEDRDEHEGHED